MAAIAVMLCMKFHICEVAVGQNLRYLFGDDQPPKVAYFKGFWDVHRATGVLTQSQVAEAEAAKDCRHRWAAIENARGQQRSHRKMTKSKQPPFNIIQHHEAHPL